MRLARSKDYAAHITMKCLTFLLMENNIHLQSDLLLKMKLYFSYRSKSKGKKKKAPGPMDLAELEEAHSDVTKLTNTDLAGVAKMSNMYEDTDKLSEESGPSLKSAVGGGVEAKKLSVEYGISKKKVPDDSKVMI